MCDRPGVPASVTVADLEDRMRRQRSVQPRRRINTLGRESSLYESPKDAPSKRKVQLLGSEPHAILVIHRFAVGRDKRRLDAADCSKPLRESTTVRLRVRIVCAQSPQL